MSSLLVVLAACSPSRDLSIVHDRADAPSYPDPYDTADTAVTPVWRGSACPPVDVAGDDVLAPSMCVRVSPEPDQVWPEEPTSAPQPRCGFFNLVGTLAVAGTAEAPVLLYCDDDVDGGVRLATWDADEGTMTSRMLDPGHCLAGTGTGSLVQTGAGYTAMWTRWEAQESTVANLQTVAHLDAIGALRDGPTDVDLPGDAVRVALVPVADGASVLVTVDNDRGLHAMTIDAAAHAASGGVRLAGDQVGYAAAPLGPDALIAACGGDAVRVLSLWRLGADLDVAWTATVADTTCAWGSTPTVATSPDGFALAWGDEDGGEWAALFDGDGAERARIDLGPTPDWSGVQPAVAWSGAGWTVIAGDGTLRTLGVDGASGVPWRHPNVVGHTGTLAQLELLPGSPTGVVMMATDYLSVPPHVYTYNYVEISAVALPSP
jgi:hypothetical protein